MDTPVWYDWLIVFFVHEISEDLPESNEMYEIIERTGSGDKNAIFLIKDAIEPDNTTLTFIYTLSISRLVKKKDGSGYQFVKVPDFHFNNKEKNCWKKAFQYIYGNFFSERKMLITFSHGAAFGIDRNSDSIGRALATPGSGASHIYPINHRRYLLNKEDIRHLTGKGWKPEEKNLFRESQNADIFVVRKNPDDPVCKALEILWISDLADALDKYLFDSCIDVMLMVNCFMQLFDNGYLLSDKVKFMVAPEGEMWASGYDYEKLLIRLRDTPSISNKALVRKIVKDYESKYTDRGQTGYLRQTTLFANELKYYGIALRGFETFVDRIREEAKRSFGLFRHIRENEVRSVSGSTSYQLVDAGVWITLVAKKFPEMAHMKEFQEWFQALHKKIVAASFVGEDFLRADSTSDSKYGYSGISLYFPANSTQLTEQEVAWCAYFDRSVSSKFNKRSNWSKFLNVYFRLSQSIAASSPPLPKDHSPVLGGILVPLPSAGMAVDTPAAVRVNTSSCSTEAGEALSSMVN